MKQILTALALLSLSPASVAAHEYWIAPETHRAEEGTTLRADLRVGQDFSGEVYPWLRRNVIAARVEGPDGAADLGGREGDIPALSVPLGGPGLYRISLHTTPAYLIFDSFDQFVRYTEYEGLTGIAERHKARGLPDKGFGEAFTRNARALVQVGPATPDQADAPSGMPFDLVAEANPFVEGLAGLPVRLTWQGQPSPDTQIAVFLLPEGGTAPQDTVRSTLRTDADGRALIPLPQAGRYMLAAVHIEELSPEESAAAVWESHWASLTFATTP